MAADTATAPPPTAEALAAAAEPATLEQPAAASGTKANGSKKPAKPDKSAKSSKGEKKAAKGKGAEDAGDGPNIAAHPRAARGIARAKSWGGLAGFVLGGYLSLPTNTLAGACLRALIAGIVCYVAVWAAAVFVWRRLVMLEIKGREQELIAAMQAARARAELPAPSGERQTAKAST